jgi:nitroimidazol reductase NimA-like FMN-containing flavoprotein (pyridoxamine 5'-phosphate oxidase superfamily)
MMAAARRGRRLFVPLRPESRMTNDDEPVLRKRFNGAVNKVPRAERLQELIARLVNNQPYAVLCTQGEGQPYGSLVAFAFSDDLTTAVFATPVATRKYRLLSECERVALLIDNRPDHVDDMMQVEAITATGRAAEVKPGSRRERCARMLVERHPYLKSFVAADSSAVFEIKVTRFLHVTRFQEVNQWVPANP